MKRTVESNTRQDNENCKQDGSGTAGNSESSICKWLGRGCFLSILFAQAIVLNHYLVVYENIKFSPHAFVLAYLPSVLFWVRGQLSHRGHTVAAAVWFLYSLPLSIIIGWIFGRILQKIKHDAIMDHGMLINTLGLSALVYTLLDVDNYSPRLGITINWIKVLDIFDHSDFLGLLLQRDSFIISDHFQTTIIAFGLLSILLTSVSLVRFARETPPDSNGVSITDPQIEIARLLVQILLVNFPFCALRIFIWHQYQIQLSVFTFKNVLMVAVNLTQIVGHSFAGCSCLFITSDGSATESSRSSHGNRLDESLSAAPTTSRRKRESRNIDLIKF